MSTVKRVLDAKRLSETLEQLREKKNIILQGPTVTDETWLAKRLAYALMGRKTRGTFATFSFT